VIKNLIHVFNGKLSVKASFCLYFLIFSFLFLLLINGLSCFFLRLLKKFGKKAKEPKDFADTYC